MTTLATVPVPTRQFRCLLDEQPIYLVPPRLLQSEGGHALLQLDVNPRCWITGSGASPAVGFDSNSLPADLGSADVWVRDAASSTLTPFWLGPRLKSLLAGAVAGGPAPRGLSADDRQVLSCAGILVDADYERRRRQAWNDLIALAADRFTSGYAPISGLVHPYLIGALRVYYRRLVRSGAFTFGDKRTPRRYVAHNEPIASFFHHQLTNLVDAIVGQPVKPSYVYFSAYQSGAELTKHLDRAQCEFSITFLLDATPEPERESPWPLYLETPRGTVTIFQCIGDGLLYKGRELVHYRYPLPSGYTSTSLFFHYVPQNFDGPQR